MSSHSAELHAWRFPVNERWIIRRKIFPPQKKKKKIYQPLAEHAPDHGGRALKVLAGRVRSAHDHQNHHSPSWPRPA